MEPKNESAKYIVGIIIIGLIIVGVSMSGGKKDDGEVKEESSEMVSTETETEEVPAPKSAEITETAASILTPKVQSVQVEYTDANGFTPDNIAVKIGDTVKFFNKSSGKMWVGSDIHPTHMNYDGTGLRDHCAAGATASFDQCASGTEYSFTFTKTGSFNYHNHSRPGMKGTVTVK